MSDIDRVLQHFSDSDPWLLRDAFEGTLITGAPGSGKSSTSGKNLAYSFLKTPHMGGLVLTAKAEETANWVDYAEKCGRSKDLIVFNAESGHMFDPLYYEWNRPGRGAGDLESIIDLFGTLLSIGKAHEGHSTERFWELAVEQLMRNVLVLLSLAGERISIAAMDAVIKSFPDRLGLEDSVEWRAQSYCGTLIEKIKERGKTLTSGQWSDLELSTVYIFKKWPGFDERPRSSIEMTWAGMADKFLFQPFARLFCSGKCTFIPEMTTHQGKIVICDFPLLEYGHETGKLINILIKLMFQRAWLRRKLSDSLNAVFLWQDEFQYFVNRRDNFFQQTCRGARVAVVCLTQNILNLSEELGEQQPGSKTKSFTGNLALKIAHQQNDVDTSTYMADLIGKEYKYVPNFTAGEGGPSTGGSMQLVYNVEPVEFSRLQKPDADQPLSGTIVYMGGKGFNATKTEQSPYGNNFLHVHFSRDVR